MSSLNLLHVIHSMDSKQGGVSQAVRTMAIGLAAEGIRNEVVCLDDANSSWFAEDPFSIHALGPSQGPWGYAAALLPWLQENLPRFDAVILHGLWLYQGYALRRALQRCNELTKLNKDLTTKRPKFFIMPHGMLDPYFQRAPGRRLKALRNWLYWRLLESSVVHQADGLFFTCETERLLAREPFAPYQPAREIVVGLGVDQPPEYTPAMHEAFVAQCPELQNRPYLLFLSRIHDKKGIDLLLSALAHLNRFSTTAGTHTSSHPFQNPDAMQETPALVIAGPGSETSYGQHLRQLAAEVSETMILFPGMLTGAAKWGAFYGCQAFVLASHQENFGIAVVEAMACGKPVLISNQVNIWREIELAQGGLVEEDTIPGVQRLLANWQALTEYQKQAMGTQAKKVYQDLFAVSQAAKKMAISLRQE